LPVDALDGSVATDDGTTVSVPDLGERGVCRSFE
jgi:hypothetical protein